MKRKPCRSFAIPVILLLVITQTFLSGCIQTHPRAAPTIEATNFPTQTATETAEAPTLRPKVALAKIPDNCSLAALSPDIEWMVIHCFPGEIGKAGRIGSSETVTLLNGDGAAMTFSPDSKKLLVVTREAIWLFNVGDWQNPKKLFSAGGVATWAPDGQSIAISYIKEGYALSILYLDGTVKNLLTETDVHKIIGPGNDFFGPAWSPDSKKIAYVSTDSWQPQPVQIRTVEIATGKKELLYSGKPGEIGFNPVWSPDGNKITLGTFLEESHPIYIYDIKEKTFTASGDFYFDYFRGWSPDSKYLAICDSKRLRVISTATNQVIDVYDCDTFLGWKGNDHIIIQQNSDLYSIPFP
jgi:Tol biopolymer transport system component